jgi:hypothetical protein
MSDDDESGDTGVGAATATTPLLSGGAGASGGFFARSSEVDAAEDDEDEDDEEAAAGSAAAEEEELLVMSASPGGGGGGSEPPSPAAAQHRGGSAHRRQRKRGARGADGTHGAHGAAEDADDDDALSQYARLAACEALLLAGYGVTRLCVRLGLPDDANTGCAARRGRPLTHTRSARAFPHDVSDAKLLHNMRPRSDGGIVASDLYQLLQMGALLAWLSGLTTRARFAWFRSRPLYALVFLCTGPVFAAIGEAPGLQVSLATVGSWGAAAWLVMLAALGVIIAVVAWHARHAARVLSRRDRIAYLASRAAVHVFFVAIWALMRLSGVGRAHFEATHLHHFFIGFLLALWGAFNHPLSATLLAIGAGIFVQGIGAYHYTWLFYVTPLGSMQRAKDAGCFTFRGNASEVGCAWSMHTNQTWGLIMCPLDVPTDVTERPSGTCFVAERGRPPPPAPPALPPWPPFPPLPPPRL